MKNMAAAVIMLVCLSVFGANPAVREAWIVSGNGNRIFFRMVLPAVEGTFPVVVLTAGGLGASAAMVLQPDYTCLAEDGFIVAGFNPQGRGEGPERSEGTEDWNGFIHQDDLKAVIEYLATLPQTDPANIGVLSQSYGVTLAAGCLGRHPELPVKYFIDLEGPSDSFVTMKDPWLLDADPANDVTAQTYALFGHYSTAMDPAPENAAWWSEREAARFMGSMRCRYLRLQAQWDHAQPPNDRYPDGFDRPPLWFQNKHAVDLVNAAVSGGAPWVRCNLPLEGNTPGASFSHEIPPLTVPGWAKDDGTLVFAAIRAMAEMPPLQIHDRPSERPADRSDFNASAFGIFGAYALEYAAFERAMHLDPEAYWAWADGHFDALGARWTRSNLQLMWDAVEPSLGGGYVWDNEFHTDDVIRHVCASGKTHWLGVFHEGGESVGGTDRPPLRNPLDYPEQYGAFVEAAVGRYKDCVGWWQIGNEIPGWIHSGRDAADYAAWVRNLVSHARAADPQARFVLMAPTQAFTLDPFLTQVLEALNGGGWFDAVDLHHWGRAQDVAMTALPAVRAALDAAAYPLAQIWSCEHGTWVGRPTGQPYQSEEDQAVSLVQRVVVNRAAGLAKLFWNNLMEWTSFGGDPGSIFNGMGLIGDGVGREEDPCGLDRPRIAYYTYRTLARATDHPAVPLPPWEPSSGAYIYPYEALWGPVYVAWSDASNTEVSLLCPSGRCEVTGLIGDELGHQERHFVEADEQGNVRVTLGPHPVMVTGSFPLH